MADKETARQTIRASWREIMPHLTAPAKVKANGETSWICPLCGHGKSGDGLTRNPQSKDGNGLKCFGCEFSGDIIDLYMQINPAADYNTTLFSLSDILGISIDTPELPENIRHSTPTINEKGEGSIDTLPGKESVKTQSSAPETPKVDYAPYFALCRDRLTDPAAVSYLTGRGISLDTARRAGLGFDPAADPANTPGATGQEYRPHPCPRIIEPNSNGGYTGRSIDPGNGFKKVIAKGSENGLFCLPSLYAPEAREVFITEGAFDALSLMEIGRSAIALNSAAQAETLITQINRRKPKATLILCLDNDAAGQRATEQIETACKGAKISYIKANVSGKYKDPNEALTADREAFIDAVEHAESRTKRPDNTAAYVDLEMQLDTVKLKESIPTGFTILDAAAGGGLYAGLYTLAAVSGLGKTTFALQIADQIAGLRRDSSGNFTPPDAQHPAHDVLFFSLEQSRLELVSKSINRTVAQINLSLPKSGEPVTSLKIRYGQENGDITAAKQIYKRGVQDRVSIIEGNFDNNITAVREYIESYISRTGTRPVVIIDYLQILLPDREKTRWNSTKEAVDSVVTGLKRISRDCSIPIIAISSMNREYYKQPVTFEALKESGAIEYTSDCIWGLQLYCLDSSELPSKDPQRQTAINQAKDAIPRVLTLKCLKNRNGPLYQVPFLYYPDKDHYIGVDDAEAQRMSNPLPFPTSTVRKK